MKKRTTLTKKTGKVYFSSPRFFSGNAFIGIRSRKNLKHKIGKQYFWWFFFLVISEFKIKYLNTIMFSLIFRNIRGTVFIMPQTQLQTNDIKTTNYIEHIKHDTNNNNRMARTFFRLQASIFVANIISRAVGFIAEILHSRQLVILILLSVKCIRKCIIIMIHASIFYLILQLWGKMSKHRQ